MDGTTGQWRRPWVDVWNEQIDWFVEAEGYGLDCAWIPEHFFTNNGFGPSMPVILTLLARAGIIDSQFLKDKRRYAIVVVFVAAAVLTPPDVISQFALAIPTLLLYEASIFSVRMVEKKRAEAEAARAAAG